MTAFNFKRQFVKPILALDKRGTIRAERVDGRVPPLGGGLQLYYGQRTRHCFRIGEAVCAYVRALRFDLPRFRAAAVYINNERVHLDQLAGFAKADGFATFTDMVAFWRDTHGGSVFRGHHIGWEHFAPADGAAERAAAF